MIVLIFLCSFLKTDFLYLYCLYTPPYCAHVSFVLLLLLLFDLSWRRLTETLEERHHAINGQSDATGTIICPSCHALYKKTHALLCRKCGAFPLSLGKQVFHQCNCVVYPHQQICYSPTTSTCQKSYLFTFYFFFFFFFFTLNH